MERKHYYLGYRYLSSSIIEVVVLPTIDPLERKDTEELSLFTLFYGFHYDK